MDAKERKERIAQNRSDEAPIVADLRSAGFAVDSVFDLVNQRFDYRTAVPVLIEWLPRISNAEVKESVVRALTVKWARPHVATLFVLEFHRATSSSLRWAIGNGLEVVADDSVLDDLLTIAREPRFGTSRQMVVLALGRLKRTEAIPVLLDLLNQDGVIGHAISSLGKLKALGARRSIEPFLQHENSWLRKEARNALARIDKAASSLQ